MAYSSFFRHFPNRNYWKITDKNSNNHQGSCQGSKRNRPFCKSRSVNFIPLGDFLHRKKRVKQRRNNYQESCEPCSDNHTKGDTKNRERTPEFLKQKQNNGND